MAEKRYGSQDPTEGFTLPYQKTRGAEAIALYNITDRTAMEWQEKLIYDILAVNDDGLWIHTRFGYSVPRQNGKNEVIAIRELFGLTEGERILHTAHRTSTSRAAWERLCVLLEGMGIEEECAEVPIGYKSGKSKGQEWIILNKELGGGRINFRTRTTTGGLGETYDLLVVDEAQEYQDDHESALKYTIVSSENPQTIYLGTPPTPYSSGTIFPNLRREILCGNKENAGWAEWSVEEETDVDNVDAWYLTNPSLGYKLTERAIKDEIGSDKTDFNIQRLGLWLRYNQKSAIAQKEWDALEVPVLPKFSGALCIGVKFNKDGSTVSLTVGIKTTDGLIFVEGIGCKPLRDGYDWLIQFMQKTKNITSKVVVDGANGTQLLADAMKDARLKPPVIVTTGEWIKANASFESNLFAGRLIHMSQPGLRDIVTNCERRAIGSAGGFGFKSIKIGADISLMDSMILAQWGVDTFQKKKVQKISY